MKCLDLVRFAINNHINPLIIGEHAAKQLLEDVEHHSPVEGWEYPFEVPEADRFPGMIGRLHGATIVQDQRFPELSMGDFTLRAVHGS